MKNIAVIDGQGGKLGRRIIEEVLALLPNAEISAIGTNSAATAAMLKGGAARGASGTNAIVVACKKADIIAGPIGIMAADAMMGEITAEAAAAVGASEALKVLVPMNKCGVRIAGVAKSAVASLIEDAAVNSQSKCNSSKGVAITERKRLQ